MLQPTQTFSAVDRKTGQPVVVDVRTFDPAAHDLPADAPPEVLEAVARAVPEAKSPADDAQLIEALRLEIIAMRERAAALEDALAVAEDQLARLDALVAAKGGQFEGESLVDAVTRLVDPARSDT